MKTKSILICLLFAITANSFTAAKAQVNVNDSLALVDLYHSTDGKHWKNNTNWLTANPVSTWYGVTVTDSRVMRLRLLNNKLKGALPASIGNLAFLTGLSLNYNGLTGIIPPSIGNLINLTYFNLGYNQLSDTIPSSIGNLTNLTYLDFSFNKQLTGAIPAAIGNLTNLTYLNLSVNLLSGTIPAEIGNLIKVTSVNLITNQLSGTIPAELGNLKNIEFLGLTNNQLSGTVPASFQKLRKLSQLDLDYNKLSASGNAASSMNDSNAVCIVSHNLFTFNGLEVIVKKYRNIIAIYDQQDTILPIHQNGNTLSLSAGGTLSNNTYEWNNSGTKDIVIIKGDSTFTPSQSGKYYVSVTNKLVTELTLYSDTISYTMPLTQTQNSVANIAAVKVIANHFSIYPNPAKDIIHVQVNGNAMIVLTTSAGKIIFLKSINNDSKINVSGYANGVYYIQNKTTGETQKIIVVH